eukprot:Pgem_evm1s17505
MFFKTVLPDPKRLSDAVRKWDVKEIRDRSVFERLKEGIKNSYEEKIFQFHSSIHQ